MALTPAGSAALDQASPGHVRTVQELFFGGLDAAEKRTLGELTAKMLRCVRGPDAGPSAVAGPTDTGTPPTT